MRQNTLITVNKFLFLYFLYDFDGTLHQSLYLHSFQCKKSSIKKREFIRVAPVRPFLSGLIRAALKN